MTLSPDDPIEIGRVGKPHGVRGAFVLEGAIDPAALVPGFTMQIGGSPYTILSRGGTDAKPLVTLAEVGDRDAIAQLRGSAVTAPRSSLTPLGDGEWFAADLIGLRVVDGGREFGRVERMLNLPSVDVLEVTGGEAPIQLPMIKDAIRAIDVDAGTITIDATFLDLG